ncbi:MAG: DNA repair protein RecN [Brumimicrobium sp.]|nr:DNA repair protein RecN [Brumimicrobium sp.]
MLTKLTVHNFALIENAQILFRNGFTVITGETGSGKSILLGALKLILGERADFSVIRDQSYKTSVEAEFTLNPNTYKSFFEENDWDWEETTIIRREIHNSGKSRAFINDTPVQLSDLKSLAERLIYIHSQHQTLELRNKKFQCSILDILAENGELLENLRLTYKQARQLQAEIEKLEENKSKLVLEQDFNQFQLEELSKLDLDKRDYAYIQTDVERASQLEDIQNAFGIIASSLQAENGAIDLLNLVKKNISVKDTTIQLLLERIQSVIVELKDIADTADNELGNLDMNSEELAEKTYLLDAFFAALKKHNLSTQDELFTLFGQLSNDIQGIEELEELIREKKKEVDTLNQKAQLLALDLSAKRKNISKSVENNVSGLLNQLKLKDATIHFDFAETTLTSDGIDDITLFFAPNKGIAPQVMEKAASGGELSRLMLALQYLLSQKKQLPTVIFDEIDTGVSGEVAEKIGIHLHNMGKNMQLIAITHLPQVASKGSNHILVKKEEEKGTTKTLLHALSQEERVVEIAKLMSGSQVTEAALLNAKNLLYNG